MTFKDRMADSSYWIMNSPEALTILLLMGSGFAGLFFGVFALAFGLNQHWFLMTLFSFFGLMSVMQFKKLIIIVRRGSLKTALGGMTANEFVWHKNKYGRRIDSDGINRHEGDESCDEQNDPGDGAIGKEVRDIYR